MKDNLVCFDTRREELERLVAGTNENPVLLHPEMAAHYRSQVARLAAVLNAEENRAEAADILRSLIDKIEMTPNAENKLDINLHGDLAGILTLAADKGGRSDSRKSDLVQQVKLVAGARNHLNLLFNAFRLERH